MPKKMKSMKSGYGEPYDGYHYAKMVKDNRHTIDFEAVTSSIRDVKVGYGRMKNESSYKDMYGKVQFMDKFKKGY